MYILWCLLCIPPLVLADFESLQHNGSNSSSCVTSEVHALILARGGSKGVKGKNLVHLDDVSLLARTIQTLRQSQVAFARIWVSTDSEDIAREALSAGAQVHRRASAYAQDDTTSLAAVQEFLQKNVHIERVALFQCSSVFLRTTYVEEAQRLFHCSDCVFAVTRLYKLRWQELADGSIKAANFDANARPRRQDWSGELYETGMFYFSTRKLIMEEQRFQNHNCRMVEVQHRDSLEIDTPDDVEVARCLFALEKYQKAVI